MTGVGCWKDKAISHRPIYFFRGSSRALPAIVSYSINAVLLNVLSRYWIVWGMVRASEICCYVTHYECKGHTAVLYSTMHGIQNASCLVDSIFSSIWLIRPFALSIGKSLIISDWNNLRAASQYRGNSIYINIFMEKLTNNPIFLLQVCGFVLDLKGVQ